MGMVFTASSVRPQLIEANRDYTGRSVWNQAFGDIGRSTDIAQQNLNISYEQSLADAYVASMQQEQQIKRSNLAEGYKNVALAENEQALNDAFESYKINYLSSKQEINQEASAAYSELNELLNKQAQNLADYGNAHYDYLSWLYAKDDSIFQNDVNFKKYMNEDRLRSIDELSATLYDIDPITGVGTLNQRGVDFFKQIENAGLTLGAGKSFSDFLRSSTQGQKLYEWALESDPYGMGERNVDLFKRLTDGAGQYTAGKASFTEKEWSTVSKDIVNKMSDWNKRLDEEGGKKKNATAIANELFGSTDEEGNVSVGAIDELRSLAEQLGLENELDSTLEGGWSGFQSRMNSYKTRVDDPSGKGTNKSNREWAVNEAIREYQTLYNAIQKLLGQKEGTLRGSLADPRADDSNVYSNEYMTRDGTKIKTSSEAENMVYKFAEDIIGAPGRVVMSPFKKVTISN